MNIIELPVSRLSFKILQHDYGDGPITLHHRHPYWGAIVLAPRLRGRSEKYDRSIVIELPPDTLLDAPSASRYLHTTHVERMMVWTQALHDNCMPARTALARFYEFYDLDDSDYDFTQTAYKAWQRWKDRHDEDCRKSPRKSRTFEERHVLRKSGVSGPAYKPVTDAELDLQIDLICMRLFRIMPNAPDYLFRQIAVFVYRSEGGRAAADVMAKFNMGKSAVYNAQKQILNLAQTDDRVKSIFEE